MTAVNPNSEDGLVRVTLNTVYQQQLQQGIDLAEIRGTLLLMAQTMTQVTDNQKDHETRIRMIERSVLTKNGMYAAIGAMGACTVVISTILSAVTR